MRNILNFAKTISLVFVLSLFIFSGAVFAQRAQPQKTPQPFSGTVTIQGDQDVYIYVGDSVTLSVVWSSTNDETHSQWFVDTVGQDSPYKLPDSEKQGSSSTFPFIGNSIGDFVVCFQVWHQEQGRNGEDCVNIHVTEPPPPPAEGCPAAPAISNEYLDSIGYTGERGFIDSAVAQAMGKGASFQGIEKCLGEGEPNPSYRAAVISFVQALLDGTFEYSGHYWLW